MKHYYWVGIYFECDGFEFADNFLLKHGTEIKTEEDVVKQYVLECVDADATFEDDRWVTDRGNISYYFFEKVPWLLGILMEKYTNSLTLDGGEK